MHPLRCPAKVSAFLAAIVATMTLVGALPAAEPSLHLAGVIRLGFDVGPSDRLAVDPSRHRGYYVSPTPTPTLAVLDLTRLRVVARRAMSLPGRAFAVDPIRHRVFSAAPVVAGRCASSWVWILDGIALTTKRAAVPCDPALGPIEVDSLSFDAPRSVLSVIGHRGRVSVLRQMSVREDEISVDWETTQRGLCAPGPDALIVRMKHGTAAHCSAGSSGRAIWIPTWHNLPVADAVGHAIIRVTETAGRASASAVDRETGRVAVASRDDDVSVYDAPYERHIVTMKPPPGAARAGSTGSAFDPDSGRLYLLRNGVVEVADVRGDAETPTQVFALQTRNVRGAQLAVDARSHRVFVPLRKGLIALQDDRRPISSRDRGAGRARGETPAVGTRALQERAADLIVAIIPRASGRHLIDLRRARAIDHRSADALVTVTSDRSVVQVTHAFSSISNVQIVQRCRLCEPLRAPPSIV